MKFATKSLKCHTRKITFRWKTHVFPKVVHTAYDVGPTSNEIFVRKTFKNSITLKFNLISYFYQVVFIFNFNYYINNTPIHFYRINNRVISNVLYWIIVYLDTILNGFSRDFFRTKKWTKFNGQWRMVNNVTSESKYSFYVLNLWQCNTEIRLKANYIAVCKFKMFVKINYIRCIGFE